MTFMNMFSYIKENYTYVYVYYIRVTGRRGNLKETLAKGLFHNSNKDAGTANKNVPRHIYF